MRNKLAAIMYGRTHETLSSGSVETLSETGSCLYQSGNQLFGYAAYDAVPADATRTASVASHLYLKTLPLAE